MSHGSAGLDQRGRELLVERVCDQGWAVAHAARARDIPDPRGPRPLRRASADLRR
nr:leucine zipper domain-containing protein [Yimella lutea]